MNHFFLALLLSICTFLFGCSQPDPIEHESDVTTATTPTPESQENPHETNCPPEDWIQTESLEEPQIAVLFKIAHFSMDGQITREEFDDNERYLEVALFGAQYLSKSEKSLRDLIDVAATPVLSVKSAAKLSAKLLADDGKSYARAGFMGSLQKNTKTCFFMIKLGQG